MTEESAVKSGDFSDVVKEASSFVGEEVELGEEVSVLGVTFVKPDKAFLIQLAQKNKDIFRAQGEAFSSVVKAETRMLEQDSQDLDIVLSKLFLLLGMLEYQCVNFFRHSSIGLGELAILSDQILMLKCMTGQALRRLKESNESISLPFKENHDAPSQGKYTGNADGNEQCDQ